jgi:adenylate cyclase class 2
MQSAEIELKFPIADLAHLQSLLPGLGFALDTPRTFEHNTLYDTPARSLRASKQILRIRRYGDLPHPQASAALSRPLDHAL